MQRKNKTRQVKEIMGTYLKEKGFEYTGYTAEGWDFQKKIDDVTQNIRIDMYLDGLRMYLSSDAYMQGIIDVKSLISEKVYKDNGLGFWKYESEEEFAKILYTYKEVLENKGLCELNKISQHASEIRPTSELHRYLYENHEDLNRKYRGVLGLSQEELVPQTVGKSLENGIEEIRNRNTEEVLLNLTGFASVYGDVLVRELAGEWMWEERCEKCVLELPGAIEIPLDILFWGWHKKVTVAKNLEETVYYKKMYYMRRKKK